MAADAAVRRTFDRTQDISKFEGYTATNVEHRWQLYLPFLDMLGVGARALDFGAGSLRESYELARRGFEVIAVDMNQTTMESYFKDYDWCGFRYRPRLIADPKLSLADLQSEAPFDLICAFDVFEHVEDLKPLVERLALRLSPDGLMFCSVPNRRSLVEIVTRVRWRLLTALGRKFAPGEPHVQFKSPAEWQHFFEQDTKLEIVAHDMAMGVFSTSWAALVALPARGIDIFLRRRFGLKSNVERLVTDRRPMALFNWIDLRLPQFARPFFGSNLFVLRSLR